ncbi:MAG: hypothetical protein HZB30_05075 [Nitrospirae bacterium]|nr:hypothetical protein [Nitrospirota bacterium]
MKTNIMACAVALLCVVFPWAALADNERLCTAETVSGKYGIQTSGFSDFVPGPNPSKIGDFVPITSVGLYELQEDGTASSSETANIGGLVFPFTGTGTFTVNPDCTGTLTRTISIGGPAEDMQFVVVQDGAKVLLMGTYPGGRLFWGQLERLSKKHH